MREFGRPASAPAEMMSNLPSPPGSPRSSLQWGGPGQTVQNSFSCPDRLSSTDARLGQISLNPEPRPAGRCMKWPPLAIGFYLSTNGLSCHFVPASSVVFDVFLHAARTPAHIAARLGPFVVLLGQNGAHKRAATGCPLFAEPADRITPGTGCSPRRGRSAADGRASARRDDQRRHSGRSVHGGAVELPGCGRPPGAPCRALAPPVGLDQ